ncbi:SHOCT domain-containing protein [Sphaerisporangium corydalis]|uniref:SHOCT domain-containing protein n=1 Tax=Sphaerisporangium corydalis TaxID=1441875 RepID=A0ABV9EQP1_9ACTN|nr:SHOCT domain-containing protein [Sphaerisporangium corydalis]
MPYAHWGPGPWWPIIPVFWALFWVTLGVLAFRARRHGWNPFTSAGRTVPWAGGGRSASVPPTAAAEKILAERYARGELSDDEYYERLSVLRGGVA